jgi:hypothetical protein
MDTGVFIVLIGAAATIAAAVIWAVALRRGGGRRWDALHFDEEVPRPRRPSATPAAPVRDRIRSALEALARRSSDDAFVIFEQKRSGKFVQFAGGGNLLLDLPLEALSGVEQSRARALFSARGVTPTEVGDHTTLQLDLEADVERATEMTLLVFREVFRIDGEFELVVTEN